MKDKKKEIISYVHLLDEYAGSLTDNILLSYIYLFFKRIQNNKNLLNHIIFLKLKVKLN